MESEYGPLSSTVPYLKKIVRKNCYRQKKVTKLPDLRVPTFLGWRQPVWEFILSTGPSFSAGLGAEYGKNFTGRFPLV